MMPTEAIERAREYLRLGNLGLAEDVLQAVLETVPQHVEALALSGVVAIRAGKPELAVTLLQRAAGVDPNNARVLEHLGMALATAGRFTDAIAPLSRAAELAPDTPGLLYNLANALASAGRLREAAEHYRAAARLGNHSAAVYFNLGNVLRELGELDDAVASYRQAVALKPQYVKALNNLAAVLRTQCQLDEALRCLAQAIRIRPDYAVGYHTLGLVLSDQRQFDEAIASQRRALELQPGLVAARNCLARLLVTQNRLDEAVELLTAGEPPHADCASAYLLVADRLRVAGKPESALQWAEKALAVAPENARVHFGKGAILRDMGRPYDAANCFRKAVEMEPNFAEVHNSLGIVLQTIGDAPAALACFEKSLALQPAEPVTHVNRAYLLLRAGDFQRGWPEFEWRQHGIHRLPNHGTALLWDGSPQPKGRVLITAEQGLGDTLQFIRYMPFVKARCARTVLCCPKSLVPLLGRSSGIDGFMTDDAAMNAGDPVLSAASLPYVFQTTLQTIPATVPYVFADPEKARLWRERLAPYRGLRVGLAWQGNRRYGGDRYRSIPLRHFAALARVGGATFFSLQKHEGREQIAELRESLPLIELGPDVDADGTFTDTAAIMECLDLIITSDTSIPHLAGALGRPVWMAVNISPDWRWLERGDTSPWYPTMRLYRQEKFNEWEPVFERITADLMALAGYHTS